MYIHPWEISRQARISFLVYIHNPDQYLTNIWNHRSKYFRNHVHFLFFFLPTFTLHIRYIVRHHSSLPTSLFTVQRLLGKPFPDNVTVYCQRFSSKYYLHLRPVFFRKYYLPWMLFWGIFLVELFLDDITVHCWWFLERLKILSLSWFMLFKEENYIRDT